MKTLKKCIALLLVPVLVLCLMPMAFAASDRIYPITVCGTAVTDANRKDILGDGTVSYDPATNILTLKNAYISAPNVFTNVLLLGTSDASLDSIKIKLVGNNVLTSGIYSTPVFNAYYCHNLEFIGNGKLACISEALSSPLVIESDHILVRGGTITMESKVNPSCYIYKAYNTDNVYAYMDRNETEWHSCENMEDMYGHPFGRITAKKTFQNLLANIFEPLTELFDRIVYLFNGNK